MPQPAAKSTRNIGQPVGSNPAMMGFLNALAMVNRGEAVTRESWDNPKTYAVMHNGKLCLYLEDKQYHPMIIVQEDFDGEDWMVVSQAGPRIPGTDRRAQTLEMAIAPPGTSPKPAPPCAAPVQHGAGPAPGLVDQSPPKDAKLDPRDQCGPDQ